MWGKKGLRPAGTVNNVDAEEKRVYVDRTKEQIKNSPEFDPENFRDPVYRDKVGGYYGTTYQESTMPSPSGIAPPSGMTPPAGVAPPPMRAGNQGSGPEQPTDFPR